MIRTAPYRPLPYYRWFWQDWRANRNVQRMTYVERGLYRELLDECWAEGFIPTDLQVLADICDCPIDVMEDAWPRLEKCFDMDSDGKMVNTRLNIERTEKDSERVKRSEAGRKGGIAKTKTTESEAQESTSQANASTCLPNASKCHIEVVLGLEGEEKRRDQKPCDQQAESRDLLGDGSEEKTSTLRIPYDKILASFRQRLPSFPQPRKLDPDRQKAVRLIWTREPEYGSIEFFDNYFQHISKSPFLLGETGWKACCFDWIMAPKNFRKIIEGNYDEGKYNA